MQTAPCQIAATQSDYAVLRRLYFSQGFWSVVFLLSCVPSLAIEIQEGPSSFIGRETGMKIIYSIPSFHSREVVLLPMARSSCQSKTIGSEM